MTDSSEVDVVVLGLGPGGEAAVGRLADEGLAVVGVDDTLVGGECPYWGCVPSKMMIRGADLLVEGRRINAMSGSAVVDPDWSPVAARLRETTDGWDDRAAVARLEDRGVRFVRGHGRLAGPGRVAVDDHEFTVRRGVLLNVGTKPWAPPIPGLDSVPYWTNREAIETEHVPESLVLLGGGAIGLELGQVFRRFGAEVTVVEVADRLLGAEEPESSELISEVLTREGVRIVTGVEVGEATHDGQRFRLRLAGHEEVVGERLLVATGRRPKLAGLGLESVGLDPQARAVTVDGRMRAGPGLWAIGDMTGVGAFTHVSMYQSGIAVEDILGRDPAEADYRALPRVTFTDPEIGSVGLSEKEARSQGLEVRTGFTSVPSSARGWIHHVGNDGFIKLVEDRQRGVLVGATASGPSGGEVLGLLVLAVHAEVPTATLRRMIYAYPTFHRAIEDGLADLAT